MPLSRYLGAQMVRAVAYEHLQLKPFREGIYLNRDWGWCARITRGDLTATDQNDLLRTYPSIPSIRLVWRWVRGLYIIMYSIAKKGVRSRSDQRKKVM